MKNLFEYKPTKEIFDSIELLKQKYPDVHSVGHKPHIQKIENEEKEIVEEKIGTIFIWDEMSDEHKKYIKDVFVDQIRSVRQKSIHMYDIYVNRVVVGRAEVNQEIESWFDELRNATNDEVIAFVKVQEGYAGKPEEHIPEPPQALLDIIQK